MQPPRLAQRLSHIAPFEVMEIQTRARALEAAGHDVIHMEIGEPDFPTPAPIVAAAQAALASSPMNYTSARGLASLREAIAAYYGQKFGVGVDPARVIVTAGSSAALLLTFGVLLNAGDEVLMADPGYPCNRHFVRNYDAVPVGVPVGADSAYQLTAAHVDAHWRERTVATLVASPANPTGTTVTAQEMQAIHRATATRGGTLIVDEIYQGLNYGVEASTALALAESESIFVINSFSKYFQMTGWRIGWMVAPDAYVRHIEVLAQNLFISPSAVAQHAAHAAFLPQTIAIVEARRRELHARRDRLVAGLEALGIRVPVVPEGAFYVYADVSAVTDDSFQFARRVLEEAHVAITPGKDFGANQPEKHIRIAYTQSVERIEQALSRLGALLPA